MHNWRKTPGAKNKASVYNFDDIIDNEDEDEITIFVVGTTNNKQAYVSSHNSGDVQLHPIDTPTSLAHYLSRMQNIEGPPGI